MESNNFPAFSRLLCIPTAKRPEGVGTFSDITSEESGWRGSHEDHSVQDFGKDVFFVSALTIASICQ